jgi:hypothetical protein
VVAVPSVAINSFNNLKVELQICCSTFLCEINRNDYLARQTFLQLKKTTLNKGDWIQVGGLVIVFMIIVLIIFSAINWPFYVTGIIVVLACILGWFVNRFIKL